MKRSICAVAVLLFASSLAHAHSELTSSIPADKASLPFGPSPAKTSPSPHRASETVVTRSIGELCPGIHT
jgi:methionine-rich copper-binding protein CopC